VLEYWPNSVGEESSTPSSARVDIEHRIKPALPILFAAATTADSIISAARQRFVLGCLHACGGSGWRRDATSAETAN
jgi:hypothetical protein